MPKEVSQIRWKNRISSNKNGSSSSRPESTAANYGGSPNTNHDHAHDDGQDRHHRHDNHHRSNKSTRDHEGSKSSAVDQLQAAAAWAWLYKHQGSRSSATEMAGKSPETRLRYMRDHYKDSMLQSNMISQAAINVQHQPASSSPQLMPMVRPSRFKVEAESNGQLTPGTPSSHASNHTKLDAADIEKISTTDTPDLHADHTKPSTATYKLMNSANNKKLMTTSVMSHVDQSKLSTGICKLRSTTDSKINTSNMSLPDHTKALMISGGTHELSDANTKKSSTSTGMSHAESQYSKLSADSHRVSADMKLAAETPHAYQITWPDPVISATDDRYKDHYSQRHDEDWRAGADHHIDDQNHDEHLYELQPNSSLLDAYELYAVSKRLRETLNHARYKNLKSAAAGAAAHDVVQQLDHGSKSKDVSDHMSSVTPAREQIYQINHQQHNHKSGHHVSHQQHQIHPQNGHNVGGFIRNIMMRPTGITPFCKSVEVASYSPLPKASRSKKLLAGPVNKPSSAADDHHIISSHNQQLEPYQKPRYKTINQDEDDDASNDQRHILSSYSRDRSISKASGDSIVSHDHHHFHHHRHLHHHHHHYHHHLVAHQRSAASQDQQRLKVRSGNSRASDDHSQPEFKLYDGLYIMPSSDKEHLPKVRPDIIKKKAAHLDPSLERYIFGTN